VPPSNDCSAARNRGGRTGTDTSTHPGAPPETARPGCVSSTTGARGQGDEPVRVRRVGPARVDDGDVDLHGRAGESFVVGSVLPATDAGMGGWRDRLAHVAGTQRDLHLRVTFGVAVTDDPAADPDDLLRRAASAARAPEA
jgi:hypothetical protein